MRPHHLFIALVLLLGPAATARADYEGAEEAAKLGHWDVVLKELRAVSMPPDYRLYVLRTRAFYAKGWLGAGDEEQYTAERAIDADTSLTPTQRTKLRTGLNADRAVAQQAAKRDYEARVALLKTIQKAPGSVTGRELLDLRPE